MSSPSIAPTDIDTEFTPTFLDTECEITPTANFESVAQAPDVADTAVGQARSRSRSRGARANKQTLEVAEMEQPASASASCFSSLAYDDQELLEMYPLGDCTSGPNLHDDKSGHDWSKSDPVDDDVTKSRESSAPAHPPHWQFLLNTMANNSRGVRLCQAAGLSVSTWGASASHAAALSGEVWETILNVIQSVPLHLRSKAAALCSDAKAAGVIFHHPSLGLSAPVHASRMVQVKLRRKPMHFYVGITQSPYDRFMSHQSVSGYRTMDAYIFENGQQSGDAERELLRLVGKIETCDNKSAGGETRTLGEPHFLYIVWK
jgi:hypothetical protein